MARAIECIRDEHRTMARLLDLLETQIDLFEQTHRPDFELIQEIIDYFRTFPDLYHHPKEDLIYRVLKQRDPEVVAGFGDLEAQHEQVSERLHKFTRAVVKVMLDAEMPRHVFVELARDFVSGERKHMAGEEAVFIPAALAVLTDDDWKDVDHKSSRFKDPLGRGAVGNRFTILTEQLASWHETPSA